VRRLIGRPMRTKSTKQVDNRSDPADGLIATRITQSGLSNCLPPKIACGIEKAILPLLRSGAPGRCGGAGVAGAQSRQPHCH
jgi:hypothetical protein